MKSGGKLSLLKKTLMEQGLRGYGISRVGLAGERIYLSLEELVQEEGYFTLVVAKKEKTGESG
jgi:precorrin-2/cobalt-factor-2 C20-methyltransferase